MMLLGALAIGTAIGVLSGMFGVGGGFMITPLLNILLGVPMPIAVGTSAVQILGVSTAGLYRRRKEKRTDYKMAVVLGGGNYMGVRLGAQMLRWLGGLGELPLPGGTMPAADFYLLCVFVLLLGSIAGWLIYDVSRRQSSIEVCEGLFARIKLPPYTEFPSLEQPRLSIPLMAYLGLGLGFLTGLLGIGGGVILLPALIYLVGMRTQCATATSMALVWLSSLIATITHALAGNTNLTLALPLLVGGTVGMQIGVALADRLGGIRLRRYFAVVVVVAAAMVAARVVAALV